jgi:hypothetical protein
MGKTRDESFQNFPEHSCKAFPDGPSQDQPVSQANPAGGQAGKGGRGPRDPPPYLSPAKEELSSTWLPCHDTTRQPGLILVF